MGERCGKTWWIFVDFLRILTEVFGSLKTKRMNCVSWRFSPERISCQMYCKRFASNRLLKDTSDV